MRVLRRRILTLNSELSTLTKVTSMEEKYLITIKGTMEQNGERESVELMTRGKFAQRNGAYYIVYAETEATGYAGCTTTVKLSADAREVVMTRFGKAPSQLVIEIDRLGMPEARTNYRHDFPLLPPDIQGWHGISITY